MIIDVHCQAIMIKFIIVMRVTTIMKHLTKRRSCFKWFSAGERIFVRNWSHGWYFSLLDFPFFTIFVVVEVMASFACFSRTNTVMIIMIIISTLTHVVNVIILIKY